MTLLGGREGASVLTEAPVRSHRGQKRQGGRLIGGMVEAVTFELGLAVGEGGANSRR